MTDLRGAEPRQIANNTSNINIATSEMIWNITLNCSFSALLSYSLNILLLLTNMFTCLIVNLKAAISSSHQVYNNAHL